MVRGGDGEYVSELVDLSLALELVGKFSGDFAPAKLPLNFA